MKVSGAKVAENRAALVDTAQKLLKERGFDGAGVAEISREAGLTQGALYSRFKSREALTAEALRTSLADAVAAVRDLRDRAPDALTAYLDAYLSDGHVKDVGAGCMIPACLSDLPRQDDEIAAIFAEGMRQLIESLQGAFPDGVASDTARRRAITLLCGVVGSVALARAMKAADPGLAKDVVDAARQELKGLARST
jgi:TetR/AcrR family transcriptional repressor of nem operon